jgi:hypothetical protein
VRYQELKFGHWLAEECPELLVWTYLEFLEDSSELSDGKIAMSYGGPALAEDVFNVGLHN